MSFSSDVKKELARCFADEDHCLLAEAAAILHYGGAAEGGREHGRILLETDNVVLAKRFLSLIRKAFDIPVSLEIRKGAPGKTNGYRILLSSDDGQQEGKDRFFRVWKEIADWEDPEFAGSLLAHSCCRRAFIRGAFLSSGTVSDPGKSYHFEISCRSREDADLLIRLIGTFDIDAKTVERKHKFPVYIKDSDAIVDILNVMGAPGALMRMENVRIIKDMKNSANRQSNCDSGNITKTVQAAAKQLDDIRLIERKMGLTKLPPQLCEIARVRLEHPEDTLKELGDYLDPPVGKSGVSHRLAKIGEIAKGIREVSHESEKTSFFV